MFYFAVINSKMRIQNRIEKLENDLAFITKLHTFQQSIEYELSGSCVSILDAFLSSQSKGLSFEAIKALFVFDHTEKEITSYQVRDTLSYTLLSKISRSIDLEQPGISGDLLFFPYKIRPGKTPVSLVAVIKISQFVTYVPATSNLFMNYRGEIESIESVFKMGRFYATEVSVFTSVYILFILAYFLSMRKSC